MVVIFDLLVWIACLDSDWFVGLVGLIYNVVVVSVAGVPFEVVRGVY